MFLKKIKIQDVRCISHLEINLASRATANNSLMLLGNNGVGKSTILKCIAIGLCDTGGATALIADMYGSIVRHGAKKGVIELTLNRGKSNYVIKTVVTPSAEDEDSEEITKTTVPKSRFPWSDVFVCGYGPSRTLTGTQSYDQYAPADAVYTLFNYGWKLQNPELVLRRLGWKNRSKEMEVLRQLAGILMMKPSALKLLRSGLTLKTEESRTDINFGALADGHQSTVNWAVDLMGWTHLNRRKNPSGVVLLDEVENHLHPKWQRHIMRLLSNAFPRIQFIATSHSPVCAVGMTDKTDRRFEVGESHVLLPTPDGVESYELVSIEGQTYDKLLESVAFDVPSVGTRLEDAMIRYRALLKDGSSPAALRKARSELAAISQTTAELEVQAELDQKLQQLLAKKNKTATMKKTVKRKRRTK